MAGEDILFWSSFIHQKNRIEGRNEPMLPRWDLYTNTFTLTICCISPLCYRSSNVGLSQGYTCRLTNKRINKYEEKRRVRKMNIGMHWYMYMRVCITKKKKNSEGNDVRITINHYAMILLYYDDSSWDSIRGITKKHGQIQMNGRMIREPWIYIYIYVYTYMMGFVFRPCWHEPIISIMQQWPTPLLSVKHTRIEWKKRTVFT